MGKRGLGREGFKQKRLGVGQRVGRVGWGGAGGSDDG